MQHTVIIGNGISGVTCARHIRKRSDERITIISAESDYFFSRTALMYIYMGQMKFEHTKPYEDHFWEKNRIELKHAWVNSVDTNNRTLHFDGGETMSYDRLVLATGSKSRQLRVPGLELDGVQGFYSLQDLDELEAHTDRLRKAEPDRRRVVIIGGGLIAVELAEMLRSRAVEVVVLVRDDRYWANVLSDGEAALVHRQFEQHGVEVKYLTEAAEFLGDDNGSVVGVKTNTGEVIDCSLVCLAIGVTPNTFLADKAGLKVGRGILVDPYLETSQKDVFAIGDCSELTHPPNGVKAINQVWYTGRMMGETLGYSLTKKRVKYQPGLWFNSAKFFELEYQTYGQVPTEEKEGQGSFFWMDEGRSKSIKLVYEVNSFIVQGINVLGIRIRHEVVDDFIRKSMRVSDVLKRFDEVMFDPEFSHDYHADLLAKWNEYHPETKIQKRRFTWF